MNAYYIITQEEQPQDDLPWELSHGFPQYYEYEWALVFAETRGKARAIFTNEYLDGWFLEPLHISKIASNINRTGGIAENDDILWIYADLASWAEGDFEVVSGIIINEYRDYPAAG